MERIESRTQNLVPRMVAAQSGC